MDHGMIAIERGIAMQAIANEAADSKGRYRNHLLDSGACLPEDGATGLLLFWETATARRIPWHNFREQTLKHLNQPTRAPPESDQHACISFAGAATLTPTTRPWPSGGARRAGRDILTSERAAHSRRNCGWRLRRACRRRRMHGAEYNAF